MEIEITNLTKIRVDARFLEKTAKEVLQKIELTKNAIHESISVVLMEPKEAQELNMYYRKKDYTPNVLSFDYGEIVLCPEQIRLDAKKYGILFKQELVRIFTHGLLHVLGYNHKQIEKLSYSL